MLHLALLLAAGFPGVPDTPFVQEYRTELAYPKDANAQKVRSLVVTPDRAVWIGSKAGVYRHRSPATGWERILPGSTYALAAQGVDVWAGAWDGLYRIQAGQPRKMAGVAGPVVALWVDGRGLVAATQERLHFFDGSRWAARPWKGARGIRAVARDARGGLWVVTIMGGYYVEPSGEVREFHDESQLLSGELSSVALAGDGSVWLGSTGGVDVYRDGRRAAHFNSASGMPNQEVEALLATPDGTLWMGTGLGALRRTADGWSLRHSRRWLPSDQVVALAQGLDGDVWVATSAGLSAIHRRTMTLAAKADHYLNICLARHVRPPYLVEQCNLAAPGDTSRFSPRDDDNDGQYTSMYLAMESYRYAVTHDPKARENARKAFHALKFLQTVTGTRGFVARTVVPAGWKTVHDPNETVSAQERADRQVRNPRSKVVERRWRLSTDGKWLWKGDTSSDEITGHFYGYLMFYDLAADEHDRQEVRAHVRRVMDYLIAGNYTLRDLDGAPTLWGFWAPGQLTSHPDWRAEKWSNTLELLSYLQTTYAITKDLQYRRRYLELIEKYGYLDYARRPLATEPSESTYFDHELVALALPGVLTEQDPAIRRVYREALQFWIARMKMDLSAYYNFTWAALAGSRTPAEFNLNECIGSLRAQPLDLVQWTVDNGRREDVGRAHRPDVELVQLDRLLPPDERPVMRWDGNPYRIVGGEAGRSESSGVFWLLPYWMARYYGFLEPPTVHAGHFY